MKSVNSPKKEVQIAGNGANFSGNYAIVLALAATLVLTGALTLLDNSPISGQLLFSVAAIVTVVSVTMRSPGRLVSVGQSVAVLLILFHGGIVGLQAMGFDVSGFNDADSWWINAKALDRSAATAAVGVSAFGLGYVLFALSGREIDSAPKSDNGVPATVALVGLGVLGASIAYWYFNLITSGIAVIGSTYSSYLQATTNQALPYVYLAIAFGIAGTIASRNKKAIALGSVLFSAFAIPAFLVGLRGEVLIPAAVALVVWSRAYPGLGGRKARLAILAILTATLWAGSIVRQTRNNSDTNVFEASLASTPLEGMVETGYSIRPLYYLIEEMGPLDTGMETYFAPLRRILQGRVFGMETLPIQSDPSVYWTAVTDNYGPIGGSVIAEAYMSSRIFGVGIVLLLVGFVCAYADWWNSNVAGDVFVGCLTFILLQWVRNDFTPVPISLLLAVLFAIAIWVSLGLGRSFRKTTNV